MESKHEAVRRAMLGKRPQSSVPQTESPVDLISGRMAGGRTTGWAVQCKKCSSSPGAPKLVINPTTKAKAIEALKEHVRLHSIGADTVASMQESLDEIRSGR